MGGRKLLKSVSALEHIKPKSDEGLGNFYTRFNKDLSGINQVITRRETICAFIRALAPRGFALYDSLSVILVYTMEKMVARFKSYINLEITKEERKAHKETSKKEI